MDRSFRIEDLKVILSIDQMRFHSRQDRFPWFQERLDRSLRLLNIDQIVGVVDEIAGCGAAFRPKLSGNESVLIREGFGTVSADAPEICQMNPRHGIETLNQCRGISVHTAALDSRGEAPGISSSATPEISC